MNNAYGMPVDDGKTAPKTKDAGNAENGLSSMSKITGMDQPMKDQARFSAGERNESLPGGFKLTQ